MTQPKALKGIDDQHLAIIGKVGSGKTYTGKGVVEVRLDSGGHVVISDPTGAWWGITLDAKGRPGPKARRICIIGGLHSHVPLPEENDAIREMAQLIMRNRISCILDTSELLAGERTRMLTVFFEQLYSSATSQPCHLVLDEADELARQNPLNEGKRLFHHIDRIVRRGRVKGFRVLMITQRPAVLHKDVLTQANALIAMRLTSPQDRGAMKAWIEGQADSVKGKAVIDSLPGLKPGTGWIWRPDDDLLVKQAMPEITSYDSSKTPEEGDVVAQQPAAASPAILALLRGVVAPPPATAAERPAMNEAQLKDLEDSTAILQRIADLERENVQFREEIASKDDSYRRAMGEAEAHIAKLTDQNRGMSEWIGGMKGKLLDTLERLSGSQVALDEARKALESVRELELVVTAPFIPPVLTPAMPSRSTQKRVAAMKGEKWQPSMGHGGSDFPSPSGSIDFSNSKWVSMSGLERLTAVLGLFPMSKRSVQIALAGLTPKGSTASTYIARLNVAKKIDPNGVGGFRLKDSVRGLQRPSKTEVFATWQKLGGKPLEILGLLAKINPNSGVSREYIGQQLSISKEGSTLSTYLSRCRANGLVQEENKHFRLIDEIRNLRA